MAETPDVAELMRKVQTSAGQRGERIERHLELLRSSAPEGSPEEILRLNETQKWANEIFHRLLSRIRRDETEKAEGDVGPGANGIALSPPDDLDELAALPGARKSRLHPKRWLGALMRPIFRKQERFNHEVVAYLRALGAMNGGTPRSSQDFLDCMRQIYKAAYFDEHFAITTQLLGTLNTFVQRETATEWALAAWNKQLVERICALLEEIDFAAARTAHAAANEAEAAGQRHASGTGADHLESADLAGLPSGLVGEQFKAELSRVRAEAAEHLRALSAKLLVIEDEMRKSATRLDRTDDSLGSVRDSLARALDSWSQLQTNLLESVRRSPVPPPTDRDAASEFPAPEFDFLAFEALTRGAEAAVSGEQLKYLPWFEGAQNVLDAGCGRGEFLELLRSANVCAYGIDSDVQMVNHCLGKGLRVLHDSLFNHLKSVPGASLGGLFLGQIVEHLPLEALAALPALAFRKLQPGAAIVIETINPTCLTTFSGAFYADPTHMKPVHPKALEYYLSASGFGDISVVFSSPIPEAAKLAPIRETAPVPTAVKDVIVQINANVERLNSVLYSYANYAIAARKPVNA